jgi:hypothetical protein
MRTGSDWPTNTSGSTPWMSISRADRTAASRYVHREHSTEYVFSSQQADIEDHCAMSLTLVDFNPYRCGDRCYRPGCGCPMRVFVGAPRGHCFYLIRVELMRI